MSTLPDGIDTFLGAAGWAGAQIAPLTGDASFRRYFRVHHEGRSAMLMHAPPPEEPRVFLHVGRWLIDQQIRVPLIYAEDLDKGWVLIEDFGDARMRDWLDENPHAEEAAYAAAIAVPMTLGAAGMAFADDTVEQGQALRAGLQALGADRGEGLVDIGPSLCRPDELFVAGHRHHHRLGLAMSTDEHRLGLGVLDPLQRRRQRRTELTKRQHLSTHTPSAYPNAYTFEYATRNGPDHAGPGPRTHPGGHRGRQSWLPGRGGVVAEQRALPPVAGTGGVPRR